MGCAVSGTDRRMRDPVTVTSSNTCAGAVASGDVDAASAGCAMLGPLRAAASASITAAATVPEVLDEYVMRSTLVVLGGVDLRVLVMPRRLVCGIDLTKGGSHGLCVVGCLQGHLRMLHARAGGDFGSAA